MSRKRLALTFAMLAFILFVPSGGAVLAQDKAVELIKRLYEEIGKKIELSEKGIEESQYAEIMSNELVVNKNDHVWPVVGNYRLTYKFYYDNAHTEEHHLPDRLRKVVMNSSMSDRSYYQEYLFDEAGALVFFFAKFDEPQVGAEPPRVEQRIYFARGRPIRIINGQKTSDRMSVRDIEDAGEIVKHGRWIKEFFDNSLTLPDG